MRNQLVFAIAVLFLISCSNGLNWQGAGNWTTSNVTTIWNYINTNYTKSIPNSTLLSGSNTVLKDFVTAFSTYLNDLWDPAWNVVVVYITDKTNADSVLYGYGFRDHWMWYNGFLMDDGYYVTFIIWKDYNCVGWITHNDNIDGQSTFDTATTALITSAITNFAPQVDPTDIWGTA
jgi:hypothetical protein